MRQVINFSLRPLLIGLISVGLSLPAVAARNPDAPAASTSQKQSSQSATKKSQTAAKKKATKKRVSKQAATSKKSKVSRYGKRRAPVARASAAERQRLQAAVNLPHRLGPTEVFQIPGVDVALNVESRAAVVMNADTGEVLYSKNSNRTMPIASITKLMTAMVVLDARLPMEELITISQEDVDTLRHSSSRLAVGATLPRWEMLLLALMSSENRAASALARTYPGGMAAAIAAMNRKAQELGMVNTHFMDGTGLHSENTASPTDLVRLVKAARSYPDINRYSTMEEHVASVRGRKLVYRNSNALVRNSQWDIEVSKTGFINEAGRCLVMQARINATPVVIVLMDGAASYTRIGDANRVKQWIETALNLDERVVAAESNSL